MNTIPVELKERSYSIHIEEGLLDSLSVLAKHSLGKVLVVSNETVFPLYGQKVLQALSALGFEAHHLVLPDGESYKTIDTALLVYNEALRLGLDRKSTLVALGGGVIGDLVGFVAASYMRGMTLVQIPTTLLAQVDSSVGGKVAVNHPQAKNLIGFFYQPSVVCIDPSTLQTLPKRELAAGLAEVVKYGVILDEAFFEYLGQKSSDILALSSESLSYTIGRCCALKAYVVSQDETEQSGYRALLNYGHTIGHAIESATDYKTYLHGEAVAMGMIYASRIALAKGLLTEEQLGQQKQLLETFGLPTTQSEVNFKTAEGILKNDKKFESGSIRFILPHGIGKAAVHSDVTWQDIQNVL